MDASQELSGKNARRTLSAPLYRAGSPVLILGGELRERSGVPFCRLTLQNVGLWTIRAVTVAIQALDGEGLPLGPELPYRYRALSVNRDLRFGGRVEIPLPVDEPADFRVRVLRVDFAEGEPWLNEGAFTPLPAAQTLEEAFGDRELAEQFRIRYGEDCRYAPAAAADLWMCTCGSVNRQEENVCHRCRRVRSAQMDVSREALERERSSRLKSEEQRGEEEKADLRRRRKKLLLYLGVIVPLLILCAGLLISVPRELERRQGYEAAQRLLAVGQYDEAAETFRALGDYRDCAEQAEKRVPYLRARDLMIRAERDDAASLLLIGRSRTELDEETTPAVLLYQAAIELLKPLGEYQDCPALIEECEAGIAESRESLRREAYDRAAELLEAGSYSAAREAFLDLEGYRDSEEQARECVYRKAAGLCDFIETYDVRGVYALVSMDSGGTSRFSLSQAKALSLGSRCVADLREACGLDLSDVSLSDQPPEELLPIADCVTALFEGLGDYRDCAERIRSIAEATDYTREFTMLCEAGDIQGALDWLKACEGEFEDREGWQKTLESYLPFCGRWSLYLGDSTVIPLTAGRSGSCASFRSRVLIRDGEAVLRLSPGGEDYTVDLRADLGSTAFRREDGAVWLAAVGPSGRFAYMKYGARGGLLSSCEYQKA